MTARAGSDIDSPSGKHSELFGRPVTESVTARAGSATDFPNGEYPEFFDRPVMESVTARTGSNKKWGIFRNCRPTGHGVSDGTGR